MLAVLDLGIDLDVWPWIWLCVAVVFALVELTAFAGSFVLLPFAVSAMGASLAGFYDAPAELQWSIFIFAGAALWMLFWNYSKRFIHDNAMPAGVGADRLVGMIAIVTSAIDSDDINRTGRVKIVGEDWGALTEESRVIPAGAKVTIRSMNGTRVMVDALVLPAPTEPPTAPRPAPPSSIPPTSEES
ncbi:MAG: hypothetical protein ACJAR2_003036 [Ilumatobacter sp.]|jgi:membrane protein implicated in regulation of membrane protease activity